MPGRHYAQRIVNAVSLHLLTMTQNARMRVGWNQDYNRPHSLYADPERAFP
jgi:hypothetical protein